MSLVAASSPIPAVCSTCEQQTVLVRVANDSAGRAANSTSPLIPSSSWQATSSHKGASAINPPVNARTTSAHVHPAAAGVNGARAANLVRPVGPDRMSLRRTPKCHEDTSTKKSPLCDFNFIAIFFRFEFKSKKISTPSLSQIKSNGTHDIKALHRLPCFWRCTQ